MSNFVDDDLDLPNFPKVDKVTPPVTGRDQIVAADDMNNVRQALLDIKDKVRAGLIASVSVMAHGAVGDGVADDTTAIQAAHDAAVATGTPLFFPPGTYLVTTPSSAPARYLTIATGSDIRWTGNGAVIKFDSRAAHAVFVNTGVSRLSITGVKFQGYTGASDDSYFYNGQFALALISSDVDVDIDQCFFDHCSPVFFFSDELINSARFSFTRNRVFNAPLAVSGGPSYARICDNWFHCDSVVTTRSHAVYCFGTCEHVIITGNSFKNIMGADIEIRAGDAHHLQKRGWTISNNDFEGSGQYSMFISTLSSEIEPGSLLVTNNRFKNVATPMQLIGVRDAIIDANIMEWDYRFAGGPNNYGVALGSSTGGGQTPIVRGCHVTNNRVIVRHPFFGTVRINTLPAVNDTVVVGAQTYTWKASASGSGEVTIAGSIDLCAQNLSYEIGGYGFTPRNLILRDGTDTFYSIFTGEGECYVASDATFTLTATGTHVTIVTQKAYLYIPGISPQTAMLFNTTVRAKTAGTAGNATTIRCVGDAGAGAGSIDDSTTDVVLHFKPNVSTVTQMETLIATSTHIEVMTAGTGARVLTAADAFAATNLQFGHNACWDMSAVVAAGIQIGLSNGTLVENNTIEIGNGGTPITLDHSMDPVIRNCTLTDGGPSGVLGQFNTRPIYDNIQTAVRHDRASTPRASDHFLSSYDAFPIIRNMGIVNDQTNILPWLQGASGWVPIGDGHAECYAFYGDELGIGDPRMRGYHWEDGDYFQLYDGTHVSNFRFKRSAPNGTTEFNSYATLLTLINTQSGGFFTATNPMVDYFGSDAVAKGYVKVKIVAGGAFPAATIDTSSNLANNGRPRSCGVTLDDWQSNVTNTKFAGGAAAATKTVVWTPLASKNVPLYVCGVDAASQSLAPVAYQADVLPGIAYVITHAADNTGGAAKFFWRVG